MTEADRRSVLWLTCAAVCWRWLVAVKTPLPGVDATHDLWLAERLVAGDLGALGALQRSGHGKGRGCLLYTS